MASCNGLEASVSYGSYGTKEKEEVIEVIVRCQEPKGDLREKGYVVCIDLSGSMQSENRLRAVKAGLLAQLDILVQELSSLSLTDLETKTRAEKTEYLSPKHLGHMSFVTFANTAQVAWSNSAPEFSDMDPWTVVESFSARGNTALYDGVYLTLEQVTKSCLPCTVLIMTDGSANKGFSDPGSFTQLYSLFPESCNLIAAGIGSQYSERLINISPVNFNHASTVDDLIDLAGNVISDIAL